MRDVDHLPDGSLAFIRQLDEREQSIGDNSAILVAQSKELAGRVELDDLEAKSREVGFELNYGSASATHSPGCSSDPIGSTMYCLPSCR